MHRFNLQSGRLFKGPIEDLLPSQPCNFLGAERLLHAHALWQGAPDGPDKADWNSIAEQVTAGSPPCREWVQDLLTYVKGTDPAGDLLSQLAHCEKTFTPPSGTNRAVGSEFLRRSTVCL